MANENEKNTNEVLSEVKTQPTFKVERTTFTGKDGEEYWSYVVNGKASYKIKGKTFYRDIKVDFSAKDQGGYEVLDIIFAIRPTAELIMHNEQMVNDKTGEVTTYTVYEIQNVDDDGNIFSYKVKPSRESDKSLLNMLINSK